MSSNIKSLRRVGIVGLSTVVAASMMSFSAVSAQADWAASGGGIGLVDTNPTTVALSDGTQGATLVTPGVSGQTLGDVRLLIPNTFKNGDTIDLTVFDRTATGTNPGQINADAAHLLGFTAAPTVVVSKTPLLAGTTVGPNTTAAVETPFNTEATGADAPKPATAGQATTAPVFNQSVVASSRANGLATDIIRLTVNGVQAAGTAPDAEWMVTLSGLKINIGPAVSPGELRVVPFAYNGAPTTTGTNASLMFGGNVVDRDGVASTYDPAINVYTVPAYVSPVNFTVAANNIVADNTTQTVGDITIVETNTYSMQTGTYVVTIGGTSGALIQNTNGATSTSPVTVTATDKATGATIDATATINSAKTTLSFALGGTPTTNTKMTVKLSGLLLQTNLKGTVTYTLSGGSIDAFMASPAGTSGPIGTPPEGVLADSTFGTANTVNGVIVITPAVVNQKDIVAPALPTVSAVATPISRRIGGNDRYETAEKIALAHGIGASESAVLASGENFPDALSSGYLANELGSSILLTHAATLPASTIEGLRLLGTKTVYIIGGPGAISAGVEAQLRATPQFIPGGTVTIGQGKLSVVRLGGADRYATNKVVNLRASALSTAANPVGRTTLTFGQPSKLTALVAAGEDSLGGADALTGGPATRGNGNGNLPLILTKSGSLNADASSQMTALGIQQTVILGQTGAVSAAVASSITGMGISVERIGGANRYETATMIADFENLGKVPTAVVDGPDSGLGFTGNHLFLARGDVFADALAGGPLAAGVPAPILLTNSTTLSTPTADWLKAHATNYLYVTALGLGAAVSQPVLDAANVAIGG